MDPEQVGNIDDLMVIMRVHKLGKLEPDADGKLIEVTLWDERVLTLTATDFMDYPQIDVTSFNEWYLGAEIRPFVDTLLSEGTPFSVAKYNRVGPSYYGTWSIEEVESSK